MTVTDPSAAIRARMAQIEARFGVGSGVRVGAASASGASFASALSAAQSDLTGAGAVSGAAVAAQSLKYLGVPYKFGGTDPATGLDCSAFVQRVYSDLGVDLPRVASDQAHSGTAVANLAAAKPGDLITFGEPADHIGIYLGNNKMIEAPHTGDVVKIIDVPSDFTAIRRIIGDTTSGGGSLDGIFQTAAAKNGVSASVLKAMAKAESGFNPNAVSAAGAQGLMQLMPSTAAGLGVNPFDPAQAVDGAARIMAGNLQRFGSLDKALAAYNAGPGAVQRYGGVPPYAETQGYVRRILDDLEGA